MMVDGGASDGGRAAFPVARPTDLDVILDHLHTAMLRLETAYTTRVSAERVFEKHRGEVIAHYTAQGESASTAERLARTDPHVIDYQHRFTDAKIDVTRLEGHVRHWQFLASITAPSSTLPTNPHASYEVREFRNTP